jgi:hypothetical protein
MAAEGVGGGGGKELFLHRQGDLSSLFFSGLSLANLLLRVYIIQLNKPFVPPENFNLWQTPEK